MQHRIEGEENGFRRNHRDARQHDFVTAAVLPAGFQQRQFRPRVAARQFCFRRIHCHDLGSVGSGDLDEIRQVILAFSILVADLLQPAKRLGSVDNHQATVATGDFTLLLRRVLMFANRDELTIFNKKSTISCRIGSLEADHDEIGA